MAKRLSSGEIAARIAASGKYSRILRKTIERVAAECAARYDGKEAEKKARNILHQSWGAYWKSKPDFGRLRDKIMRDLETGGNIRESLLPALSLQSSTRERIPLLDSFYGEIFSVTGTPRTVADLACGLNPLTIPWMGLPDGAEYTGFDIDEEQNGFLNAVLKLPAFGEVRARVHAGDAFTDAPGRADVAFMLKVLPLLERQKKGAGLEVMRMQDCAHLVVSFPAAGLSGRKRGMGGFHAERIMYTVSKEGWKAEKLEFSTETVFIISRGN